MTESNSNAVPTANVDDLRADGFDVAAFHPTAVAATDVTSAYQVVLINTELPSDIAGGARSALQAHVGALLDQLAERQPRH